MHGLENECAVRSNRGRYGSKWKSGENDIMTEVMQEGKKERGGRKDEA